MFVGTLCKFSVFKNAEIKITYGIVKIFQFISFSILETGKPTRNEK